MLISTLRNHHVTLASMQFYPPPRSEKEMSLQNTIKHSNSEILTGRLWRKDHSSFKSLPFYSDIPRMDEIAPPLQKALGIESLEGCYRTLLVVRELAFFWAN